MLMATLIPTHVSIFILFISQLDILKQNISLLIFAKKKKESGVDHLQGLLVRMCGVFFEVCYGLSIWLSTGCGLG